MYKSKYRIQLPQEEQEKLAGMVHRGKHNASVVTRARILLQLHEGQIDTKIASGLRVAMATIWRLKKLYISEGLGAALREKLEKKGHPTILDGRGEAQLIQLACSAPPQGRSRWTVRLLGTRLVELGAVPSIGKSTVHKALKKMNWHLIKRSNG